jgi:hypothetical protein
LRAAPGGLPVAIDHVGSTSVPGLPAKDCIDVQVRMKAVDETGDVPLLAAVGLGCRPEPWNRFEVSGGQSCRKLVFAPPVGARSCNVHLRESGGPNARFALLFRDRLDRSRRLPGTILTRRAPSRDPVPSRVHLSGSLTAGGIRSWSGVLLAPLVHALTMPVQRASR